MFAEAVAIVQAQEVRSVSRNSRAANVAGDLLKAMRELSVLPLTTLTPAEVIESHFAGMSMDDLVRELAAGRLCGGRGREASDLEFPAWQFVEPAPQLLPPVMRAVHEAGGVDPRYFWTIRYEGLFDLTPAELLCGKLFVTRRSVSMEQADYLARSDKERQRIVVAHHEALLAERDGPHA